MLRRFELLSGVRINFHKSTICGVGVDKDMVSGFALVIRCRLTSFPLKYLGLPFGSSARLCITWKPVFR